MASPQKDDGYIQISNELLEALARTRIPGEVRQILDFIIRRTYGWNKKMDWITLDQFAAGTGLSKVHVCQGIKRLMVMNLIVRSLLDPITEKGNENKERRLTYGIQKDYERWRPLPKKVTLPKKVISFTEKGNKPRKTITEKGKLQKTTYKVLKDKKDMCAPLFEQFWIAYPDRNGKKLEKAETMRRYGQYPESDWLLINQAAVNYAQSRMVQDGIGIKDPKRFIRDGKGSEPWRDWITPENNTEPGEDWIKRWSEPNSES